MSLTDLLTDLGMEEEKAKEYSVRWDETDFDNLFVQLECLVGFDNAVKIISEGSVLDYRNGHLDTYMNMVRLVSGQMSNRVSEENIGIFYSLDSLNSHVDGSSEEDRIDLSGVNLGFYRILHRGNEQSVGYLNQLIEDGCIAFSETEHWNTSSKSSGPRAAKIGININSQLKRLFGELGLDEPRINLNYGQRSIEVDEYTSRMLKRIRSEAYKEQS